MTAALLIAITAVVAIPTQTVVSIKWDDGSAPTYSEVAAALTFDFQTGVANVQSLGDGQFRVLGIANYSQLWIRASARLTADGPTKTKLVSFVRSAGQGWPPATIPVKLFRNNPNERQFQGAIEPTGYLFAYEQQWYDPDQNAIGYRPMFVREPNVAVLQIQEPYREAVQVYCDDNEGECIDLCCDRPIVQCQEPRLVSFGTPSPAFGDIAPEGCSRLTPANLAIESNRFSAKGPTPRPDGG